ncbi:ABC transporter permease [Enterococcus mundtii]|uniref:ABC transporter permease subunit n=1 Tax=Enterococcus mundtii TaxID=53346 RepID=UPI000D3436E1|nr:ABC transporter permease subunit [Enterococcus mundtii]PTO40551.1 ABC transporter permease [Enterococcus mundtii]PTO41463.1 ABC transporter permease [Enterococcus mundtii]
MQIFKFESEKILKNKSIIGAGLVLLLSLFAIVYIGFFQSQLRGAKNITNVSGRESIERYLDFTNEYQGELTDHKVKKITSDYLKIYQDKKGKNIQIFDYFQWSVVDTFTNHEEQDVYVEMIDAIRDGKKYTIDDVNLLSMKNVGYKKMGFPIKIGNFKTWTDLLNVTSTAFIPVSLFVILICSILFANDTSKNIIPLLLSTRYGRTKMIKSKILVGTGMAIASFLIVQLIILIIFYIYYGFSGWDVSVQANLDWQVFDFPLEWSMLQAYMFGVVFQLIGVLFIAGVTMLISSLSSSPFSALAISLGVFVIPKPLTHIFMSGIPNKILYLFPINTLEIDKVLLWMSRDNMFFFHSFVANVALILIVLLVTKAVLDTSIYVRMKKLSLS